MCKLIHALSRVLKNANSLRNIDEQARHEIVRQSCLYRILDTLRAGDYDFAVFVFLLNVPGTVLNTLLRGVVIKDKTG